MKILFFMGRNRKNKSGLSWKIWKISRKGRNVTLAWGPATVVDRKVVPAGTLQTKRLHFPSIEIANRYEEQRLRDKTAKGYQRRTRWRSA